MENNPANMQLIGLFINILTKSYNELENFEIKMKDTQGNESKHIIGYDIYIIHIIGSKNECVMGDIVKEIGLPNSSATRRISKLVELNLVKRRDALKDHRKIMLKLTKEGWLLFNQFFTFIYNKFERIFRDISDSERNIMLKFFKRLLNDNTKEKEKML